MISDTPNENDHETNSHHSITDSLHSHDSPHHDHNEDNQLEIEETRGLGQAISSAFSSIVGALSGKKSRQKSEGYESEHVESVSGISPESKKSNEDKPLMDTVMEAMEKEEYAVQEFVPETIVVTETASNENAEEEEEQQHLEVQVQEHPDMIEVEDDNEVLQEQSEDVGVTEITIRYQEIVDENSRVNAGFDEEKVEERQAIVEIQEEERESNEIELLQQQNNELREGEMENELVVPEENQEQEQDVIIEEKMEEEHQPEPEPQVHREEVVLVQQHDEEKASSHNTEPVAESPNEQPERKGESPVRQEQVIDLVQEQHDVPLHEPMLTDMNTVEGEEITAALDKEDKLQIVGNIIEVSSEEPVLSQERENLGMDSNHPMQVENEKPNESLDRLLQYSPKGLNHTNEDVLLDTSNHSNQQMLIENDENEMQVVPVLEYIEEDHNENDITRIEEPDEIMIEVQDPIEECPESQEMTSILPMMEINTESVIVSALPKPAETKNNHTATNLNIPKKNEPQQKRGIVPPTRISTARNTSLVDKKPVSEVKTRGIQSAVPKTTITKPKFPPEFASLTAQRKPVVSVKPVKNVQQITPKRDNSSNKSLATNIVPQRKPLVAQQPNTVNTKKRKAEEVWTKGSDELKQVKKNNYVPTAKEKERVNIFQRNTTTVNTTMKPPQNRTPRVSVDKNSAHNKDGEPSNENEQLSEGQKLSGNKPMCVVCSGIIEARTDSQMLSCLHKIHKRCFLVMEKKKSQCPACNSSTMNRNGFQPQVNTTPGSKRQEKKMVY